MGIPVRVLFVEDSEDDAELELIELRGGGFEPQHLRVETATELRTALEHGPWDVVVSDFNMPAFSGFDALRVVQEMDLAVPFILVSGTIGEEIAVQAVQAGAHDYVLKSQLARLPAAVTRALREAQVAQQRRRAERAERFLARTTATLTESLHYEQTLEQVARLSVPEMADWCIIDVRDAAGELRTVATTHVDPNMAQLARDLRRRYPPEPDAVRGAAAVIRSGRPELVPEIEDSMLAESVRDPEHLRVLRELGLTSYICVPLRARNTTLGALTLASSRSGRHYDTFDLNTAIELAGRAALAMDNARLYREAQMAVHIRDEFLSIASHELKSPLTALQLQLEGIQNALARAGADEGADLGRLARRVSGALRTNQRLIALVENLLDVTRLLSGGLSLTLEVLDLGELVADVVHRFEEQAARAGTVLMLTAEREVTGRWDRVRLEQIFSNLLSNALKYGGGKPVDVRVVRHGEHAVVSVTDQGIGIEAADLERIFARFERAVPVRHYGGLGLGLYIACQAAQAHGGRLRAESTPGHGATFWLELPLAPPDGPHDGEAGRSVAVDGDAGPVDSSAD